MTMDYPVGTVLQYKSSQGYGSWTVIEAHDELVTLELTSVDSPTEIRPIGHKVPTTSAAIDSHIRGKFVLNVILPSTIGEIET